MIRINLLPVRVSKKKAAGQAAARPLRRARRRRLRGQLRLGAGARGRSQGPEQKIAKTREEIAQLDRIIGEVKNIKEQQAALREKLDILAQLKAGRAGPVRVMDALATLTPKRLWISKFDEKGGSATITGQAVDHRRRLGVHDRR